ncbi:MAG: YciI family protein [Pyrinomonadaceae bacterium]
MKKIRNLLVIFTMAVIAAVSGFAQTPEKAVNSVYDAELAKKLGADEYGLKQYIFVILKTGPNNAKYQGKERDDLFAGHFTNMGKMAAENKLAVAGPFDKNDRSYSGIFILNVTTLEEAQTLVNADPTVKAGVLVAEMTPWYGSASLMMTSEIHKKIAKKKP